ncbi:hypothetical protein KP803_13310 [Vibrio sp. ZSDE26]|uniref:Transposase n=1 Tax=Vibrio amylolyticus TaxID=2847292 RepID=A0A9X1XM90_9VIBR|nr:hypothetical protein [Vibrio amylolyticus]MCK6264253.1 hypothetical protein [Vibrio amylolyticus]
MPAYISGKKTQQYTTEFKVTAVRLSLRDNFEDISFVVYGIHDRLFVRCSSISKTYS